MDDYDAYLYSIDDDQEFVEEGESDNDILDNLDEDQVHTETAVVLAPASSPTTRQGESGDEKQSKASATALKSLAQCKMFVDIHLTLVALTFTMPSRALTEGGYHIAHACSNKPVNIVFGFSGFKGKQKEIIEAAFSGECACHDA